MSIRTLVLPAAILSALLASPTGFAAEPDAVDSLLSGRISGPIVLSEAYEQITRHANALDANGDGTIDADELSAARDAQLAARMQERFTRVDTNADGAIDATEFAAARGGRQTAGMDERFAKLDANGDGGIDKAEFNAAFPARSATRQGRGMGLRDEAKPMSVEHFIATRKARLAAMDADGDGVISAEESRSGRRDMMEQRLQRSQDRPHRRGRGTEGEINPPAEH